MEANILQRFLSYFNSETNTDSQPDPKFVADQLRKPTEGFAEEIGEKMNAVNAPLYDLTIEAMQLQDRDKVLEIGFGTGKFFGKLFSEAEGLKITGIDFSDAMVAMAKANNRVFTASGKLSLKRGSSASISFPDGTFDKVFCNMVIYFWDQPDAHLSEVHRVLKPGGIFYTGFRTRESMQVFPFVEHGFNLYGVEEWQNILDRNGFSVLQTHSAIDPVMDLEGNTIRLKSCCIAATKN